MTRAPCCSRPEGPVPYGPANEAMHRLAERRLAGEIPDTVILLEHPPVFTAGRRARPDELLWSPERGGRARRARSTGSTAAAPSRSMAPVRSWGTRSSTLVPKPDAAAHLRRMEEAVIRTGSEFGAELRRREDVQTGVWHGDDKVCAIGVRLMRARVTLHGFALNCDPDLSWWDGIVACGLPGHGATSLSRIAERRITVPEAVPVLERHIADVFGLSFRHVDAWAPAEAEPAAV